MTNREKEILAKGQMIFEMCLEKGSTDCIIGFVEDQIKLGNLDLMQLFFDQLQSKSLSVNSLEKEALSNIKNLLYPI